MPEKENVKLLRLDFTEKSMSALYLGLAVFVHPKAVRGVVSAPVVSAADAHDNAVAVGSRITGAPVLVVGRICEP